MAKRYLQEFMAKMDEEYNVVIYSYENVFTPDNLNKVKSALMPYRLREMNKGGTLLSQEYPEQFPHIPFCNLYRIDAKVGIMPKNGYERIRQDLTQALKIEAKRLHVSENGKATGGEEDIVHAANPKMTKMVEKEKERVSADKLHGPGLLKYFKEQNKKDPEAGWSAYTIKEHTFITTHDVLAEANIGCNRGLYKCKLTENGIFVIGQVEQSQADLPFYSDYDEINFSSLEDHEFTDVPEVQGVSIVDQIVSVITDAGLTVASLSDDEEDFLPDVQSLQDGLWRCVIQDNSVDCETLQAVANSLGAVTIEVHLVVDRDWNRLGLIFAID